MKYFIHKTLYNFDKSRSVSYTRKGTGLKAKACVQVSDLTLSLAMSPWTVFTPRLTSLFFV